MATERGSAARGLRPRPDAVQLHLAAAAWHVPWCAALDRGYRSPDQTPVSQSVPILDTQVPPRSMFLRQPQHSILNHSSDWYGACPFMRRSRARKAPATNLHVSVSCKETPSCEHERGGESRGILPRVRSHISGSVLAASPLRTPDAYRSVVATVSQAEATLKSRPALSHGPTDRIRAPSEAAPWTIGGSEETCCERRERARVG